MNHINPLFSLKCLNYYCFSLTSELTATRFEDIKLPEESSPKLGNQNNYAFNHFESMLTWRKQSQTISRNLQGNKIIDINGNCCVFSRQSGPIIISFVTT